MFFGEILPSWEQNFDQRSLRIQGFGSGGFEAKGSWVCGALEGFERKVELSGLCVKGHFFPPSIF